MRRTRPHNLGALALAALLGACAGAHADDVPAPKSPADAPSPAVPASAAPAVASAEVAAPPTREVCTPASTCSPGAWCALPALSCAVDPIEIAHAEWKTEQVLVDPRGGLLVITTDLTLRWIDVVDGELRDTRLTLDRPPKRLVAVLRQGEAIWIIGDSGEGRRRWPVPLATPGVRVAPVVQPPPAVAQLEATLADLDRAIDAHDRCIRSGGGCRHDQSARRRFDATRRRFDAARGVAASDLSIGSADPARTVATAAGLDGAGMTAIAEVGLVRLWSAAEAEADLFGFRHPVIESRTTGAMYRPDRGFGARSVVSISGVIGSATSAPPPIVLLAVGDDVLIAHHRPGHLRVALLRARPAATGADR